MKQLSDFFFIGWRIAAANDFFFNMEHSQEKYFTATEAQGLWKTFNNGQKITSSAN